MIWKKPSLFFFITSTLLHITSCFTTFSAYEKRKNRTQNANGECGHPLGWTLLTLAAATNSGDKGEAGTSGTIKLTAEAEELESLIQNKSDSGKLLVAQTAPSVRVAFSELYGELPGVYPPGALVASLKALGFDVVLDTNIAADLTICEEGTELLHRIREKLEKTAESEVVHTAEMKHPLPMFTSCCPGWMNFVAKKNPELCPFISTCKSPHMMLGAMIKHYSQDLLGRDSSEIYLTSVMPCVKKRGESDHLVFTHDGVRDVDNVITARDLGDLLRLHCIVPSELEPEAYDSPFQLEEQNSDGLGSGAGQLFGATGGVMEAAVRSVYELLTESQLPRLELEEVRGLDGVKEANVSLFDEATGKGIDMELHVAVANGLGNAKKIIEAINSGTVNYDMVEIMACPGGCIGGGGMPRSKDKTMLDKRMQVIYALDKSLPIRRSHENPCIKAFYDRYLKEMGSKEAHELLHVEPVYGESSKSNDTDS